MDKTQLRVCCSSKSAVCYAGPFQALLKERTTLRWDFPSHPEIIFGSNAWKAERTIPAGARRGWASLRSTFSNAFFKDVCWEGRAVFGWYFSPEGTQRSYRRNRRNRRSYRRNSCNLSGLETECVWFMWEPYVPILFIQPKLFLLRDVCSGTLSADY